VKALPVDPGGVKKAGGRATRRSSSSLQQDTSINQTAKELFPDKAILWNSHCGTGATVPIEWMIPELRSGTAKGNGQDKFETGK
jgi:hypothetical protein